MLRYQDDSHAMSAQEPSKETYQTQGPVTVINECDPSDTHVMKFIVKTTGITHRLSVLVSSPQSRGGCLAVSTAGSFSSG